MLQLSLQLLTGPKAPQATAGLLADTLHLLAAGLEEAPQRTRKDLSLKLLLLFSQVAAGVGSSTGIVRADLGHLMVAVAVAAEGLDSSMRLLRDNVGSSNSISRMSPRDIQVRAALSLWLLLVLPCTNTPGHAFIALPLPRSFGLTRQEPLPQAGAP